METIVFLDRKTVDAEFRPPRLVHDWRNFDLTLPSDIEKRLQGASIAVSNKVPLRQGDLRNLPGLRLIVAAATGVDHIDLGACRELGIRVANARGYATHSVVEHVFMLILALRRNLPAYRNIVDGGGWENAEFFSLIHPPIGDLHGQTLGIIGHGSLGQAVAHVAEAFGLRVIIGERKGVATPRPGRFAFEAVLEQADIVSLHCPLTPDTRDMFGTAEFARMKPSALFINVARGGIVDEAALASALEQGAIAAAGVDVLAQEPPPADNPLIRLHRPNLIVTPHNAWASRQAMQTLAEQIVENIESFAAGNLLRAVV